MIVFIERGHIHTHVQPTRPRLPAYPWLNNPTIKTDSLTIWSDILSERMNCMHACIRNAPALYPSSFLYNYLSTPLHCSVGIPSGWCECNVCKLDIMFVCNFIVNVDNTNVPYIVSVHYSENGILIRARALSYAPTHTHTHHGMDCECSLYTTNTIASDFIPLSIWNVETNKHPIKFVRTMQQ